MAVEDTEQNAHDEEEVHNHACDKAHFAGNGHFLITKPPAAHRDSECVLRVVNDEKTESDYDGPQELIRSRVACIDVEISC